MFQWCGRQHAEDGATWGRRTSPTARSTRSPCRPRTSASQLRGGRGFEFHFFWYGRHPSCMFWNGQSFFTYLWSFSNKHQYNFYNKLMWKNVIPSNIRCRDSNLRPLNHESFPITTRRGVPLLGFTLNAVLIRSMKLVVWSKVLRLYLLFSHKIALIAL